MTEPDDTTIPYPNPSGARVPAEALYHMHLHKIEVAWKERIARLTEVATHLCDELGHISIDVLREPTFWEWFPRGLWGVYVRRVVRVRPEVQIDEPAGQVSIQWGDMTGNAWGGLRRTWMFDAPVDLDTFTAHVAVAIAEHTAYMRRYHPRG